MKNLKLIAIIATALLLTSTFCALSTVFATQPPIDTSTYYVGTIGQPARMDPARAYDTASGELIQNVAQTLIWWNDKHVISFTPLVGHNLALSEYANLDSYAPVLASALPTVVYNASGAYYTFTIRTTATFQPWTAANGSVIPARNLKASDVIYSFQRQMVYDSYYAPTWMWFGSAFTGDASVGLWNAYDSYANGTFKSPADEAAAAALIQSWCYPGPGANDVSFHFQQPWAQGVLQQIFAQTWGSIIEPEWCQERGGWSGTFPVGASASNMNAGWTNQWHWKPTVTRSEIDAYKDPAIYTAGGGSKYTGSNHHVNEIMGTGPYLFTSWDQTNKIWRIDQYAAYWGGWAGSHVTTVISKGIDSWPTRKMLFLEGEFDTCAVPTANMFDLLTSDAYHPAPGINLVYNIARLANDMMFFCMNVTGTSSYQSFVGYPSHQTSAEPLFFANQHMRLAFAWAINYTQYIGEAYFGEGIQQASWWVDGLSPPEAKNTALTLRNLNLANMQSELNLAVVDGINVGSAGFETTIVYNIGNDQRKIAADLIAAAFTSLGSKYKVNVVGLDWPVELDLMNSFGMPAYSIGWLADFADPHNFAQPYMQSTGNFPIAQGPPFPADQSIIDAEINQAIIETNATARILEYQDLQARFYNDAITLPLVQPAARRWARDWVQGWYFNALFPGLYAYDLYKSVSSLQNVDLDMTGTVTPASPTPAVTYIFHSQMRIGNGNANPDVRSYSLHVVRDDNNAAVALLYAAVGLTYTTGSNKQFGNGTYVALAPLGSATSSLVWWCDGSTGLAMAGSPTGVAYAIAGETQPFGGNVTDTNTANNFQAAGTLTAKTLPGDITGNGLVDIYDAIQLANAFGTKTGQARFNPDADLNPVPDGNVDIYDAIILAGNFNKHVP
jgi:peptide/nickel transport system substrate-binding protein